MALDYLPSPGWAVIYGETPSATRWSELGDNDDALATGAGIDDNAILARHIANNAVGVTELDLSTLPNNRTVIPSGTFATSSGANVQVTGATVSITLAKAARIEVGCRMQAMTNGAATGYVEVGLWQGAVNSGTLLAYLSQQGSAGVAPLYIMGETAVLPAGTYSFNLSIKAAVTGSASTFNNSPYTGLIAAKVIG